MKTKAINIQAKEWFDKVNGNSYFAGTITLNEGTETEEIFLMMFQNGYGFSYEHEAKATLTQFNKISTEYESLSNYCKRVGIELNSNIERGCLKRDLKAIEDRYNQQLETV
jgi:hypothetical protein